MRNTPFRKPACIAEKHAKTTIETNMGCSLRFVGAGPIAGVCVEMQEETVSVLADCVAQVFATRSLNRLKLLCEILDVYSQNENALELCPENLLLSRKLTHVAALSSRGDPLDTSLKAAVTVRHRFTPPETLRGEVELPLFGRAHRAALLVLYLLSGGVKGVGSVPFASCATLAELVSAPDPQLSSLPHWKEFAAECAVVDACLNRQQPKRRPSLQELQKAVRRLLWAKEGHLEDPDAVAFFLSFGATEVKRGRLVKFWMLESLVPRQVHRVGGLRRMNRPFLDCAVTTMLCLKRLGLNRDVAFLIVQWVIRRELNPFRCILVERDVDLASEERFDHVAQAVSRACYGNSSMVTIGRFSAVVKALGCKRHMSANWMFDFIRCVTLNVQSLPVVAVQQHLGVDGMVLHPHCHGVKMHRVRRFGGGQFAHEAPNGTLSPAYSSLFRAVMHRVHRADCARRVWNAALGLPLLEGSGVLVHKVRLRQVEVPGVTSIRYRISSKNRLHFCFVVQEGSSFFLLPSLEVPDRLFAFASLRKLVKRYETELEWLQSESEEVSAALDVRQEVPATVPPECMWLVEMLRVAPEVMEGVIGGL